MADTPAPPNGKKTRVAKQSLVSKLADVQAAIGVIAKTGRNTFQNYSYAEEAAIVEAVRGELAKRSIMVLPSILSVTREDTLTTIKTSYTITDGDSGESLTCEWAGTGSDKQDKGLYKAVTGSLKYFLLKTFLMPTGDNGIADDPEHPAREVADEPTLPAPRPQGQTQEGKTYVTQYEVQKGVTNDREWIRYSIGFSTGEKTSTFDDALGDLADHAKQNRLPVTPILAVNQKNPQYTDLVELTLDASA